MTPTSTSWRVRQNVCRSRLATWPDSGESDDHYFEVNYDSAAREFELITIWPYDDDTQLPGGKLVPRAGDTYILWNIRMPDDCSRLAKVEVAVAVEQYNKELLAGHCRLQGPDGPCVYKGARHRPVCGPTGEAGEPEVFSGKRLPAEPYHQISAAR